MIVEMLGSPGAGKTSLMPAVIEFFNRQGQKAYTVIEASRAMAARTPTGKLITRLLPEGLRRPALWRLFYANTRKYQPVFARQHTELMERVLSFQRQRPITESDRRHVLRWFMHLTGVVAFMGKYLLPDEVLVIDEGFVHRVVQLFASEKEELDRKRVTDYLKLIPRADLIVYVLSPGELSTQRVFDRGLWKRFEDKTEDATLRYLKNAQAVVQFAADFLIQEGWPVIEVKNSGQSVDAANFELQQALSVWTNRSQEFIPV